MEHMLNLEGTYGKIRDASGQIILFPSVSSDFTHNGFIVQEKSLGRYFAPRFRGAREKSLSHGDLRTGIPNQTQFRLT